MCMFCSPLYKFIPFTQSKHFRIIFLDKTIRNRYSFISVAQHTNPYFMSFCHFIYEKVAIKGNYIIVNNKTRLQPFVIINVQFCHIWVTFRVFSLCELNRKCKKMEMSPFCSCPVAPILISLAVCFIFSGLRLLSGD